MGTKLTQSCPFFYFACNYGYEAQYGYKICGLVDCCCGLFIFRYSPDDRAGNIRQGSCCRSSTSHEGMVSIFLRVGGVSARRPSSLAAREKDEKLTVVSYSTILRPIPSPGIAPLFQRLEGIGSGAVRSSGPSEPWAAGRIHPPDPA